MEYSQCAGGHVEPDIRPEKITRNMYVEIWTHPVTNYDWKISEF